MKRYRLGLDLGVSSIGWCLLRLNEDNDPVSLKKMGVRIFSTGRDDKTSSSLATKRGELRRIRRQRDRYLRRRAKILNFLIRNEFMSQDEMKRKNLEKLNPWKLRSKGLKEKLPIEHFARAVFHISQRRGFLSNAKSDKNTSSKMKDAIERFKEKLKETESETVGDYFYNQIKEKNNNETPKIRFSNIGGEGNKADWDLYPQRDMVKDEFNLLWVKQASFHKQLTEDRKKKLFDIIFFQRPLKEQEIGNCLFEPTEKRAYKALPLYQEFIVWQKINNLKLFNQDTGEIRELTLEEKNIVADQLYKKSSETYIRLRKLLFAKSADSFLFNFEYKDNQKSTIGHKTNNAMSAKKCFGKVWYSLPLHEQTQIIETVLKNYSKDDENEIVSTFCDKYSLTEKQARSIVFSSLEDGTGSLSTKALNKILPYLKEGYLYNQACEKAGYHHSNFYSGEICESLPYYGKVLERYNQPFNIHILPREFITRDGERDIEKLEKAIAKASQKNAPKGLKNQYSRLCEYRYGKIANPTVHIALNQIRKLVNEVIRVYGHPEQIHIETARELPFGKKRLDEIKKIQKRNTKDNERIGKELKELEAKNNYINRRRYRLWEELAGKPIERCCPYSGKQIPISSLFSDKVEIDHILPFSRTFDNSLNNQVLCYAQANRKKGNKTPYEAFHDIKSGDFAWNKIQERMKNLPKKKWWRFSKNAIDEVGDDFLERQLNDTKYISRVAGEYLSTICPPNKIVQIAGRLTGMFRTWWGLNSILNDDKGNKSKNRDDHRHHAIDAFVVACTSRGVMNLLHRLSQKYQIKNMKNHFNLPIQNLQDSSRFYNVIKQNVDRIIVSHKPDIGDAKLALKSKTTTGFLHKETAYGFKKHGNEPFLTERKQLVDLNDKNLTSTLNRIDRIVCECKGDKKKSECTEKRTLCQCIKCRLKRELYGIESKTKRKEIMVTFSEENNIKKVKTKLNGSEASGIKSYAGIENRYQNIYKYYKKKNNYCTDLFQIDGQWDIEIISVYDAHKANFIPKWRGHKEAKLISILFINDYLRYTKDNRIIVGKVKKMTNGRIFLIDNYEVRTTYHHEWSVSAHQLKIHKAQKVYVDILGNVKPARR